MSCSSSEMSSSFFECTHTVVDVLVMRKDEQSTVRLQSFLLALSVSWRAEKVMLLCWLWLASLSVEFMHRVSGMDVVDEPAGVASVTLQVLTVGIFAHGCGACNTESAICEVFLIL